MDSVVLLDEAGHALGAASKVAVHGADTPLHLAFSCYVFNRPGRFLLTRRAESKRVFPGVWTNSCCGHPGPGEDPSVAVRRRVREELGLSLSRVVLLLPRFRYRAEMNGIAENELCPVYGGFCDDDPVPDPAEVAETVWTGWAEFAERVRAGLLPVSPWCQEQVAELAALGPDPARWPEASPADLPPAARPQGQPAVLRACDRDLASGFAYCEIEETGILLRAITGEIFSSYCGGMNHPIQAAPGMKNSHEGAARCRST